jgi:hypothetical protein
MLKFCKTQAFAGAPRNKYAEVAVSIAGGPSLTQEDVRLVEKSGYTLLGINNAYQLTDRLTYHYGCDTEWWRQHIHKVQPWTQKFSLKKSKKDSGIAGVTQMQRGERNCLSHEWPILCTGGNSGYQAINLLYLLGYTTIILIGYDMQMQGKKAHWHPDHPGGLANPRQATFNNWRKSFEQLGGKLKKAGVTVINATRQTALDSFKQARLEDIV